MKLGDHFLINSAFRSGFGLNSLATKVEVQKSVFPKGMLVIPTNHEPYVNGIVTLIGLISGKRDKAHDVCKVVYSNNEADVRYIYRYHLEQASVLKAI